jgi:hypothetical protein
MAGNDYEEQLIAVARPYWAAETEIPRRFVAAKPAKQDYINYLRSAVYKELNPAIGYAPPERYACNLHQEFAELVDQFPALHNGADRHAIYQRLHMMTEEFNHYLVLADAYEFILGRKLRDGDIGQLPEDRKLNDMRRKYMESGKPSLQAAMGLTEGGGSRTFAELAKLKGGEMEDRIARAMGVIYKDEKAHFEEAAQAAAALVQTDDDLQRMKQVIAEVSLQRVKMRFEQFSEPMAWSEVEALIEDEQAKVA